MFSAVLSSIGERRMNNKLIAKINASKTKVTKVNNYSFEILIKQQAKAAQAGIELVKLKKQLGKRNFKAILKCHSHTIACKKSEFSNIKGGKKITQKFFLESCDVYSSIKAEFNSMQLRRGVILENLFARRSKNAELHKRINTGDAGIAHASNKRLITIRNEIEKNATSTSGDTILNIKLTDNPALVDYDSYTSKGEQYSRSCTWRKTDLTINATLPKNWLSRVYNKGYTYVDGMFNLDLSTPLKSEKIPAEFTVYAATWLQKSRGSSFNVVRGFIAEHKESDTHYHSKTLTSAINGLAKKTEMAILLAELKTIKKSQLIGSALKSDKTVKLSYSKKVGNCSWGTEDFCYRNQIDISGDNPQMSLAEFAKIVEKEPRIEALAVISYALRAV